MGEEQQTNVSFLCRRLALCEPVLTLLAYAYIRFVYNVKSFSTVHDILDKIPVLEFVGRRFIHEARMNLRASASSFGLAYISFQ